jgi:hypothetical protein
MVMQRARLADDPKVNVRCAGQDCCALSSELNGGPDRSLGVDDLVTAPCWRDAHQENVTILQLEPANFYLLNAHSAVSG